MKVQLLLVMVAVLAVSSAFGQTPTWFPVVVGSSSLSPNAYTTVNPTTPAWYLNNFYPNNITINVGDILAFKWGSAMEHTITFDPTGACLKNTLTCTFPSGNPALFNGTAFLNSGIAPEEATSVAYPYGYNVTFTAQGTFVLTCALHPWMTITVNVNPMSTNYPLSNTAVAAAAAGTISYVQAQTVLWDNVTKALETTKPMKWNGNNYWVVTGGYDIPPPLGVSNLRFYPYMLTIQVNDTVTFVSSYLEPHAMAFNGTYGIDVEYGTSSIYNAPFAPIVGPNGQVGTIVNGAIAVTYDGSYLITSTLIFGAQNPAAVVPGYMTMWNITFTTPGSYPYRCSLHDDFGMAGVINVMAPPTVSSSTGGTGGSGAAAILSPSLALLAAISLLLFVLF